MNDRAVLTVKNVSRSYAQAGGALTILQSANLEIASGETIALVGPSGSGKSTLLHIAGLLDTPTQGEVWMDKQNTSSASDAVRTFIRNLHIGFVYQYHHLLPEFTAEENIVIPQLLAGIPRKQASARAQELLALMGLSERAGHRPAELSGGEQQRVAIARALANRPQLLLADEPTGNLDVVTAEKVMQIILSAAQDQGVAVLMATHNLDLAKRLNRIVTIKNGQVMPYAHG